jgi:hypothetical protein
LAVVEALGWMQGQEPSPDPGRCGGLPLKTGQRVLLRFVVDNERLRVFVDDEDCLIDEPDASISSAVLNYYADDGSAFDVAVERFGVKYVNEKS